MPPRFAKVKPLRAMMKMGEAAYQADPEAESAQAGNSAGMMMVSWMPIEEVDDEQTLKA